MICPICGGETRVADSRKDIDCVIRYRKCLECGCGFYTIEIDRDIYQRLTKGHTSDEGDDNDKGFWPT